LRSIEVVSGVHMRWMEKERSEVALGFLPTSDIGNEVTWPKLTTPFLRTVPAFGLVLSMPEREARYSQEKIHGKQVLQHRDERRIGLTRESPKVNEEIYCDEWICFLQKPRKVLQLYATDMYVAV
jgi:hypothetical protein